MVKRMYFTSGFVNDYGVEVLGTAENIGTGQRWTMWCPYCFGKFAVVSHRVKTVKSCRSCKGMNRRGDPKKQAYKDIWRAVCKGAAERGIPMLLDFDTYIEIASKPCRYCGTIDVKKGREHYINDVQLNGLDRKDRTKPYELSNVVPCCKRCNYGKWIDKEEDFLRWIRMVAEYNAVCTTSFAHTL